MNVPQTLPEGLAMLNGCLNATAAGLLLAGYFNIRRGRVVVHRRFMISAFVTSAIFLVSYLTRMALSGDKLFPRSGLIHVVYLVILISHVSLALVVVPLVLRTLWLGLHRRFTEHRRIARWTFPIWAYVSVTGVIVYLMLYQMYPR